MFIQGLNLVFLMTNGDLFFCSLHAFVNYILIIINQFYYYKNLEKFFIKRIIEMFGYHSHKIICPLGISTKEQNTRYRMFNHTLPVGKCCRAQTNSASKQQGAVMWSAVSFITFLSVSPSFAYHPPTHPRQHHVLLDVPPSPVFYS